ncbi:MAG: SUMF1/EgtB/PvdO family nonheme iron enzyme [Bacteroidetes bacterium]|nr:SUMF1/EgtB/PvdO family nonheme iron enzyme [Bacteroidota bacterium]
MSTVHNIPVSEKELDNLLAQAFLNLDFNDSKNNELMETISTHHLVQAPTIITALKKFFGGKFLISMLLLSIVAVFVLTRNPEETTNTENKLITTPVSDSPELNQHANPAGPYKTGQNQSGAVQENTPANEMQKNPDESGNLIPSVSDENQKNQIHHSHPVNAGLVKQPADSGYIFPTLTEEETRDHYKQKNKMIAALSKLNKDKYAYIPSGTCDYKKQVISVKAFYAQTTEVTNLEYRTFLSDLILQGRKQEFLDALPDQTQWIKRVPTSYNEPMAEHYFSHPSYNDYPVVNISRKGAEMYCKWLTEETNKVLKKNNKPLIMNLRLPDEFEWAYAAFNGENDLQYAHGNTYLRNSKGSYEMNYLGYSIDECTYDSIRHLYLPAVDINKIQLDGGFYTVKTTSYLPNNYGLYCMAGNVSEMIIAHNTQKPATKGGSWFSCDHFLEIEAEDEYPGETGASPFIGFRPVLTMKTE